MDKKSIMLFLQRNWLPILLLIIIAYSLINTQIKYNRYEKLIKSKEEKIDSLNKVIKEELDNIEEMKEIDTVYITEIKEIKIKADENIKYVDTMSVSDMQSFFSERYRKN